MSIRLYFPTETDDNQGGVSDGVVFTTVFAGSTYVNTFEMVKEFLKENDFGDLPLPKNFEELKLFRLKCMKNQLNFCGIGRLFSLIKSGICSGLRMGNTCSPVILLGRLMNNKAGEWRGK